MNQSKDLNARITEEECRLKKLFKDVDPRRKDTVQGLIQRAAFMRVSLEDLERDINQNGFTEEFSQGKQDPYLRERPVSKVYCTLNAGYQKIIKQLTDLLPKEEPQSGDDSDGDKFDQF